MRLDHRIRRRALAAGVSYLLVGAFPNDPGLYQDSSIRGAAGGVFVIALPAAVVLGGVALRRSGWRGASVWSLAAGIAMACLALLTTALSAVAGTHQPQLSAAIILQALASAWYLGMGMWLLLLSWAGAGRISDGARVPRLLRLVGAGLAALSAAGLAGSAALVGVILGPTTLAQVTGRTQIATLTQGMVTRSYRVYRPARMAAQPGLVIVLPGRTVTATRRRWYPASISRPTAWAGSLPIQMASQMVGTPSEMRAGGGAGIAALTMWRSLPR